MGAAEKRDDGLIDASADEWMLDADVQPDNDAEPLSSSIRLSDAGGPPSAALSFRVYTLDDLERRTDAPISMRLSRLAFESLPRRRDGKWTATWSAFRVLASSTLGWVKTRDELGRRPPIKATLWPALDAFGNAAQVVVDGVDWKRHGVTLGVTAFAMLTLLFGVLLCAEMTDDLKPGSGPHLASTAALEVAPRVVTPVATPRIEPSAPVDEAEDVEPPPPRPAPRARVKAKGKLTFRNADAIFNP